MRKNTSNKSRQFKIPDIDVVCPKCKHKGLTIGKIKDFKCIKCLYEFDSKEGKP